MSNQALMDALNLAKAGNWEAAHDIVQDLHCSGAARIHAYLHRLEGDDSNARYWYNRAGVEFPNVSIDNEWELIFADVSAGN